MNLVKICKEMNNQVAVGKRNGFKYKHVPNFHAVIIDGDYDFGKIYLSPYLYGLERKHCPGIEVTKYKSEVLFNRYLKAAKAFIQSGSNIRQIC